MPVDDQLAWEARQRPKAVAAAVLAGLLTLAAGIYTAVGFGDIPRASFLEALGNVAADGPIGPMPSLRVGLYEFYSEHQSRFILAALLSSAGTLAAGGALTYLAFATRARRAQMPRAGLYVPFVGAALLAVGAILYAIGTGSTVDNLLDGPKTVDAVGDIKGSSVLVAGQLIEVVGRFALGAGYVLVALNAMRSGLLTRFMGVLGIIVGGLLVLPLLQGPPVVQSFWLIALGVLFAGRWPNGTPPAWRTGREEPWPSAAELRAQRDATRGRPARGPAPAEAAPEPEAAAAPAGRPHPSSKKRKRKKRG